MSHFAAATLLNFSTISFSVGNRPCSFFENNTSLPTETMKMPPAPRTSSLSRQRSFLIAAARLAARGRKFQTPQ